MIAGFENACPEVIVTTAPPLVGSTFTLVVHLRVLGAVASTEWLPGSTGMGVFHSLLATAVPSRVS